MFRFVMAVLGLVLAWNLGMGAYVLYDERRSCERSAMEGQQWAWGPVSGCFVELRPGVWQKMQDTGGDKR